jgi:hypothetical protein
MAEADPSKGHKRSISNGSTEAEAGDDLESRNDSNPGSEDDNNGFAHGEGDLFANLGAGVEGNVESAGDQGQVEGNDEDESSKEASSDGKS